MLLPLHEAESLGKVSQREEVFPGLISGIPALRFDLVSEIPVSLLRITPSVRSLG